MKAKLKVLLPGFTGNMDDVVIYYNSKLGKYIARKKVKPTFTPDHSLTQEMHTFRRRISVSEDYIDDCRGCDYLFSQYGYNAGWATWKRCWEYFDFEMKALPAVLQDKVFYDLFSDVKIANTYQKRFSKLQQMNTTPSFWTAQFGLQIVLHRGLFIIPRANLIKNIGVEGDHTNSKNKYHNVESEEDFRVEKHPEFVIPSRELMAWHYKKRIRIIYGDIPMWMRFIRKVKNRIPAYWRR